MHEEKLIDLALKPHLQEMKMGSNELLTCETYDAIEQFSPTMIFVDYAKASKVQEILAEKYCPHLANATIEANMASEKEHKVFVQIKDGMNVTLREWLEKKPSHLQWTLELNRAPDHGCLVKTRRMEDDLYSCEGGFLNAKALLKQ